MQEAQQEKEHRGHSILCRKWSVKGFVQMAQSVMRKNTVVIKNDLVCVLFSVNKKKNHFFHIVVVSVLRRLLSSRHPSTSLVVNHLLTRIHHSCHRVMVSGYPSNNAPTG